jgi:protein-S-isoprenylcysteine O-methyltransferase Ste14
VFEAWVVTAFPVLFLVILFGGGTLLRRRNIDMDGEAPINRKVFLASKYLIVIVWITTILYGWGINLFFFESSGFIKPVSVCLWVVGFLLLFTGRFIMGDSFRIGFPKEKTGLRTDGLFRFSRNPMYLGVFTTLIASVLYTLNPIILIIAIFIIAVHHKIVLAEEKYLQKSFGEEYRVYCGKARRYI